MIWLFLLLGTAIKNKPSSGPLSSLRSHSPAHLESLRQVTQDAILDSYKRLESSDEEGRTATAARDKDGSWLLRDRFETVKETFAELMIDETDAMVNTMLQASPWPIWMNFTSGGAFELSLFCVPAGKTHEPRRHPAGTILVYKRVFGHMRMRSMIGSREIAKDDLSDLVLVRLAGKSIVFESLDGRPAGVFEIAIHPPRRDEEGMGSTSGFDDDDGAVTRMCRIDLNIADGERMFTQVSKNSNDNAMKKKDPNSNQVSVSSLQQSIGGLSTQLHTLVRRIIVSRQLPTTLLRQLGLTHVKGLLLYGPPGCGKTLIARQLATVFNNEIEPKIVNGPEILSKYVGEAEANIRALFLDAEEEWKEKGAASGLHVVIFDELDSIARRRWYSIPRYPTPPYPFPRYTTPPYPNHSYPFSLYPNRPYPTLPHPNISNHHQWKSILSLIL